MNLGHLLSSVCSSGNFTVTQAVLLFVRNYPFFMRADFCCKLLAKSHTQWLPSWQYGTVTCCWLGAAVSHVFTIWAPRHYWLSALSPQADWGERRADWGLTTEHHHWSLTWAHGLHIEGLVSMIVTGPGGIQPKQFAVNQRREKAELQWCPTEKATLNSCLAS